MSATSVDECFSLDICCEIVLEVHRSSIWNILLGRLGCRVGLLLLRRSLTLSILGVLHGLHHGIHALLESTETGLGCDRRDVQGGSDFVKVDL